jgi:hypothetical protein
VKKSKKAKVSKHHNNNKITTTTTTKILGDTYLNGAMQKFFKKHVFE